MFFVISNHVVGLKKIMFLHRAYPGPPAVKGDAPLASLDRCEFSRHSTWASYNPDTYAFFS